MREPINRLVALRFRAGDRAHLRLHASNRAGGRCERCTATPRRPIRSCSTPGCRARARRTASRKANARRATCSACGSCRSPKGSRARATSRSCPTAMRSSRSCRAACASFATACCRPEPLAGWPAAGLEAGGLQAAIVHPQFATNRIVYLYYIKSNADAKTTLALARARLVGTELQNVEEVFVTDAWIQGGPLAGRAAFGPDGMIYLTINDHDKNNAIDDPSVRIFAQHLDSDVGKVLRLRDDGSIPPDNPFVGRDGRESADLHLRPPQRDGLRVAPDDGRALGHRDRADGRRRAQHPARGHNYGWPLVSLGKLYNKHDINEQHWYREGMDMPFMYWTPSISPSSLVVVHGRQARAVAGQLVRRRAERPDAATRRVRSAGAAGRAPRLAVHVARPALAPSRAEPRRLSLRRDREAHAGNAARSERRDERRRLPHRAGGLGGRMRATTAAAMSLLFVAWVAEGQQRSASVAAVIEDLVAANRVLAAQGILPGYGHVSARHPENPLVATSSRVRSLRSW